MKRKYLSALLMGVLTLSSVSTFTSCKDYDDDISNLQEQIDKLATADQLSQKVAELQALISSNKSDITSLQTKVAEALTAAQKAQTTADSKATLDEVKAELEKYATKDEVATVKATLEAAQKALEEKNDAALKDAVQKAQEAADKAVADAKAAVEEVKTDLASYKTTVASEQEVVNTALATLNTKVDAKADTTALNNAIAALTAADANAKAEILSEIASKYATKKQADEIDAALKEFADKIEKQLGEYATTAEVQRLLAELKKNADVTYATKEEIKNLQTKKAVEEAINNAIGELKKGDLEAVNKIAKEALEKANKAESEKGLAYLKALAAEGAAADAAKDAKAADAKAVKNQTDIKNIQDALGAGFDAKNTVAKAIQLINDQLTAKNTGLSGLDGRLKSIESKLALEDPDKSLVERVSKIEDQLKEIIGEYTTMVTEVNLLGSFKTDGTLTAPNESELQFTSGTVADDFIFGKAEMASATYQVPAATNQQTFVKGTTFNTKTELVVRVNPVNAVLTKAAIKLVDSKNNNLDNILEIGEPEKYDKLFTSPTRAANNTGLWKIPVTVKPGVARTAIEQLNDGKHILYAVAVNNTNSEAAKDRYVTSTYDIVVPGAKEFDKPTPLTTIGNVKIKSVNTMAGESPILLSNAMPYADGRVRGTIVPAKSGEDITIDFGAYKDKIQYFYVVRDDNNVDGGSGSSAINAWKSYEYGGSAYGNVVEVNPADKTPTINVKINGQKGDRIGFRIFAVKYNGKVIPENGQSFVVNVGEDENQVSVTGEVDAYYNATKVAAGKKNETGWLKLSSPLKGNSALDATWSTKVGNETITFGVEYSTDGETVAAINGSQNKNIKYIRFTCTTDLMKWNDGLKATGTISTKNSDNMVENEIAVSLTKHLPSVQTTKEIYNYTWKDEQLDNGKYYKAYVYPTGGWNTNATTGYKNLLEAITGLQPGFDIVIDNTAKDGDGNYTLSSLVPSTTTTTQTAWNVTVDKELVDGTTEHKTTISYNYGPISTDHKNANGDYVITLESVQTVFTCPLNDKDQTYTWKKHEFKNAQGKVTSTAEVNVLTYGDGKTLKIGGTDAAPVYANLLEYIIGHNTLANKEFGGELKNLVNGTSKKYKSITAKLISNQSKKEDYFTTSISNDGVISFTPVANNTSNPVKDVKSTLVITLTDAFGHVMVYPMEFTVKRAE